MPEKAVILFDGVCNFCNSSINFVIRNDKKAQFQFAPLQSEAAQKLAGNRILSTPDTVILIENDIIYEKSTAALRIAKKLDGLWPVLYGLILIPKFFRDPIYDLIARNRYKLFGKKESCMIPSPEIKSRFL
jgi:predicted DCC family thiol-disulfide oxidoreductase YuxK